MNASDAWLPLPDVAAITPADIHVYRVNLDCDDDEIGRFMAWLSTDEKERATRFHFERDRRRFIAGRGVLRSIIGRYLQRPPAEVQFEYGQYGKPRLAQAGELADLQFNVAHAREIGLLAFAQTIDIGVDVETVRPLADADAVVSRYFSPEEVEAFNRLPVEQQQTAFFNGWTRKEAFIKAVGDGLSYPLRRFSVTLAPGDGARLLRIDGDEIQANEWSLRTLMPAPGFVAALAMRGQSASSGRGAWGQPWRLQCYHWPD